MSEHISEELPRLLTGDANRDVVLTAAAHLRVCPDCQQELVSAVIAHASLTSAHRFAPEIVAPASDAPTIGREPENVSDAPMALPDLSTVFAQAREDATTAARAPARRRRRLIGVAAAAVVVIGGGVTGGLLATGDDTSTPSAHAVLLSAYPSGNTPAKITISGSQLRVDATKLPRLDQQHVYELWLTNGTRTKMQSVGTIGDDNRAELTIAPTVLSRYSNFEVSVQQASQLNRYSGHSVLRGDYS